MLLHMDSDAIEVIDNNPSNAKSKTEADVEADVISATLSDLFLNDVWSLYFHDPDNMDWNLSSYIKLCDVRSVAEFWNSMLVVKPKLSQGMFFYMRTDSFPCWDDASNVNGGCLSMKVLKEHVDEFLLTLCMRAAGETLLLPEYADKQYLLNGISTSPKRYFCVVKIWLRDDTLGSKTYFNIPRLYNGDIFYRKNLDVIHSQR